MIHDPDRITIAVVSDDAIVSGNLSVSLGLIATELVINSLKHAFPDKRTGKITVTYKEENGSWTLSVTDDGIGISADPAHAVAGLGTSIVQALARQLDATVDVADARPGTMVSISRLYRAYPGLDQVTTDDTLSGLLGDDFSRADDGLVQFVGIGDRMSPQTFDLSADQGDLLLLTTDGFHGGRDGAFLTELAEGADVAGGALMRKSDRMSFSDNATAVMIHRQQALSELALPRKCALLVNSTTGDCAI